MHAAGQARIKTANGAHDVDAFELVGAVLFEDRRILNCIFVWPRRSVDISWDSRSTVWADTDDSWRSCRSGSPRGERARREPLRGSRNRCASSGTLKSVHVFVRPACNSARAFSAKCRRQRPRRPGSTCVRGHVQWRCSTWGSSTRTPLRAATSSLADTSSRSCRWTSHSRCRPSRPERSPRSLAMGPPPVSSARWSPGSLVEPPRRHDPGVLPAEIAFLRPRKSSLIPRMMLVNWIAQRILLDECLASSASRRSRNYQAGCECSG